MGRERCWKCQKIRNDVRLRSTDDRLCEACFDKNEADLEVVRRRAAGGSTDSRPASRLDSMTPTNATTRRAPTTSESAPLSSPASTVATGGAVVAATEAASKPSKRTAGILNAASARGSPASSTSSTISSQISVKRDVRRYEGEQQANDPSLRKQADDVTARTTNNQQDVVADVKDQSSAAPIDEVSALRLIISNQQDEIRKLQYQLKFISSYLGISERIEESRQHATQSASMYAVSASTELQAASADEQESWTEVVSKQHRQRSGDTFQHSVVTAVYVDQSLKRSRETSLIVTGLEPTVTKADAELVTALCLTELHIQPDIASTKRLGHSQTGKIQPLLVYLKLADQAKQLISSAKQLRQSTDPAVRNKVFINPNLTRAEATAAYQVRVQRRLAFQRRQRHKHDDNNHGNGNKSPTEQHLQEINDATQRNGPVFGSETQLNPLADPFNYPASSVPVTSD
jgi:hypothetical protein